MAALGSSKSIGAIRVLSMVFLIVVA
ncbi:hypothetical protein C5167_009381 [Papaver somniferum]|uniref:Uncharacterized protein n=1 Tax=Papaver somniferum TaxID=3469 RepID=A0A4Y7K180_PAPSO|nr:hypothetical protein C5167_009381 [Papaver somniferum]